MTERPSDAAPGGMRGATRMHDPTEARQDRRRRWLMNLAFAAILLATIIQVHWSRVHGWDWLRAFLSVIAGVPLGLAVKVFELRFKMASDERRRVLRELPRASKAGLIAYAALVVLAAGLSRQSAVWMLWGGWIYDFVTYYHDRPERIRHLYAIMKTLEELRDFWLPWAWPLPALVWGIVRILL